MTDEREEREELIELMRNAAAKGKEISGYGSDLQRYGQNLIDFVGAGIPCMEYPMENRPPEPLRQAWLYANDEADTLLSGLGSISPPLIQSSTDATSGTVIGAMADYANPGKFVTLVPKEYEARAKQDSERLRSVFNRAAEKAKVLELLCRCGLTSPNRTGLASPTELYKTAWAAYEKPATTTNPASTSLIPMRECINETVDALLRRRPRIEEAGRQEAKIRSIGKQLARDGVPVHIIDSLADRRSTLNSKLSDAKTAKHSRDMWMAVFDEANQFLYSLLSILDPGKFHK